MADNSQYTEFCHACSGDGIRARHICQWCDGTGEMTEEQIEEYWSDFWERHGYDENPTED